jgi:glycosyltransferase involved in cell wall biosynthesis
MLVNQSVINPLRALLAPESVWIFSGYPPSPAFALFSSRSILYVHDLFLIERRGELNRTARFYMGPNFRLALRRFRLFLANSATTAERLRPYVAQISTVQLYRPAARNVLKLGASAREKASPLAPIVIGMLGTIEPRKNYLAAAKICRELQSQLGRSVELHIVGRPGWGGEAEKLQKLPNVRLHGFVNEEGIARIVGQWDLFLSTSHDEGLGLPLLEFQYAGIPIFAPDGPVFREVLGESGIYIDAANAARAALAIAEVIRSPDRGPRFRVAARKNISRWNGLASRDHDDVIELLSRMTMNMRRALQ